MVPRKRTYLGYYFYHFFQEKSITFPHFQLFPISSGWCFVLNLPTGILGESSRLPGPSPVPRALLEGRSVALGRAVRPAPRHTPDTGTVGARGHGPPRLSRTCQAPEAPASVFLLQGSVRGPRGNAPGGTLNGQAKGQTDRHPSLVLSPRVPGQVGPGQGSVLWGRLVLSATPSHSCCWRSPPTQTTRTHILVSGSAVREPR